MNEFWAAIVGAGVGGLLTFVGGVVYEVVFRPWIEKRREKSLVKKNLLLIRQKLQYIRKGKINYLTPTINSLITSLCTVGEIARIMQKSIHESTFFADEYKGEWFSYLSDLEGSAALLSNNLQNRTETGGRFLTQDIPINAFKEKNLIHVGELLDRFDSITKTSGVKL